MSDTKINLNFNNFAGYYANLYHSGYGGFDWFNMMELNGSMINNVLDYCDTGYNNVLHGRGEGVVLDNGFMYTYAQTFNLKSGTFASAWETNQPVYIYAAANGAITGEIKVNLSQNPTTIDFAKYGSEFKNINLIEIRVAGNGQGGSTCTYGQATYGYQVAFDNLKITMNTGGTHHAEHGRPAMLLQALAHHHAAHIANPFAALAIANPDGHSGPTGLSSSHHAGQAGSGYHAELMLLDGAGHHDTGLTSQFALPQIEHFGL